MQRKYDVITGSNTIPEELFTLHKFPVNMLADGNTNVENDPLYDMQFGIFPDSGVIQLLDLVPEELVYVDTHSNAVGGVWKRQHELLSSVIAKYFPSSILELGGGTGILEKTYNSHADKKVNSWIIIDPEPNPIDTNAKFIKGFFPDAMPKNLEFDILVHSHTWEHAYSSREFIKNISIILKAGQRMIFSVPNLKYLMEQAMTSILNFEHTIYLSDDYVEYLLDEFGMKIENKIFFENHSIIYDTVKTDRNKHNVNLSLLYEKNKSLFENYIKIHQSKMHKLNEIRHSSFLFGGHITTQFYIAFGLDKSMICGILDNDKFKHGKRVSGTTWKIQPPAILKNLSSPFVILPSSPYSEEIKKQIIGEINAHTRFIEI